MCLPHPFGPRRDPDDPTHVSQVTESEVETIVSDPLLKGGIGTTSKPLLTSTPRPVLPCEKEYGRRGLCMESEGGTPVHVSLMVGQHGVEYPKTHG